MDIAAILDEAIDLEEQGRLKEALARFEQVLAAEPQNSIARAGVLGARAATACDEGRLNEAIDLCNSALSAGAYDLRALTVRARAYLGLGRNADALADCLKVLTYAPEFADALAVRGSAFIALGEPETGVSDLEAAAVLKPDLKFLLGQALHYAMHICRWEGFDKKLEALLEAVDLGRPATRPFWLLSLPSTPDQQKSAAAVYFAETVKVAAVDVPRPSAAEKIRIGYFSTDFCAHAISHLVTGMLEAHDSARFDVTAFALKGSALDPVRMQVAGAVDRLIDCADLPDADIADLARRAGIDIALDLGVYTARQPSLFARRVAPLQVNYLGYAGTSAAPCYDYVIGDPVLTPFAHRRHFSEQIVQLPHCYQPNSLRRYGALQHPLRKELGLPEKGFVFCCFNDGFKILPHVFDIWMRLVREVEGSVLWLLQYNPVAAKNLKAEAAKRGIDPDRLVFAPRVPIGQHLARHYAADLFLDTSPYNAHTTASDALWGGLPIVTCKGETFASRVAASILTAVGLPDLVTESLKDYERRALELAREPAQLADVRARLRRNRETSPLFDTARYTRNIERAFEQMWTRQLSGLPPQEFAVTDPDRL
jgi:predicted O-linked N-acetylglucosamine transferase (SPINDLY family)